MEKYLIIKTRDELLRIKISQILYFEADRNYSKLVLSNGIQFTFAINIGKVEELLESQYADVTSSLVRVGKSHVINKNHILQISLPKQKLVLIGDEGKPRELGLSKEPLRVLKDMLEHDAANIDRGTITDDKTTDVIKSEVDTTIEKEESEA